MDISIIDDYLPSYNFQSLLKLLDKGFFPWYESKSQTFEKRLNTNIFRVESILLYHLFFLKENQSLKTSSYFDTLRNIFPICNNADLRLIRANLVLPRFDIRHTPYHRDMMKYNAEGYVALYYLHGNSSPTIFKNGFKRKLIFPKKNRLIVFPNRLQHAQYLPVRDKRMVINFNFTHQFPISNLEN